MGYLYYTCCINSIRSNSFPTTSTSMCGFCSKRFGATLSLTPLLGVRDSGCCSLGSNGNSVLTGIGIWGSTATRLYLVVSPVCFPFYERTLYAYTGQNAMYSSVISVISPLKWLMSPPRNKLAVNRLAANRLARCQVKFVSWNVTSLKHTVKHKKVLLHLKQRNVGIAFLQERL